MPRRTNRNLRHLNLLCFSNSCPESESPPMSPTATAISSHHDHIHHNHPPCPSPSIMNMIKNFNSLYDPTLTFDPSLCSSSASTSFEPGPEPEPADFATAFASQRFFFSSPGRSNSLVDYTNSNTSTDCTQQYTPSSLTATTPPPEGKPDGDKKEVFFNGSVAVPTYSPDPYLDFRRSMQEMVEARPELMDVTSNWNILHELLLCYLALNPKSTHKFILGAFADLLVSLMPF